MSEETDKETTPAPAAPANRPAAPAAAPVANIGDDGHWARPVAQRRDRHIRAWLLLLSLICFVVAFRGPINRLYWNARNRMFGPEPLPEGTADCFLALSYEGISALPDPDGKFTSAARFREHLTALRDAGYNPIGLSDVRAFYKEGRKLPEKAVLVTFENTHKSTFFEGAPVLGEFRWRATMGVVTRRVRENDPDSILAPYLRDLILDEAWDLACESDAGIDLVQAGPHGRTALALSAPEWNAEENRPERPDEFEARVQADHDRALAVFEKELGMRPIAYFFPSGNYGQYEERNRVLRAVNLRAVSERYELSFLLGSRALNTAGTDPRRLNRLRVVPEWTAETLLSRLDREWPVQAGRGGAGSLVAPDRWFADWGVVEPAGDSVRIRAQPASDQTRSDADATGGARAWIAGTDGFREGSLEFRFLLQRGEFHAYLPFAADDDWIRAEITDTGHATVRRCDPNSGPERIAAGSVATVSDFRSTHSLLLTVRDGLLFVRLDGETLFGGPVEIPAGDAFHPGIVGAGVWGDVPGLAQTEILETHLRPRTDALVTWAPALSRDTAHLSLNLRRDAFRDSVIAPPWLDVYAASPVSFPPFDPQVLAAVATASRARVMPTVSPHDVRALAALDPTDVVRRLGEEPADGVFLDAAAFPADHLAELRDWAARLHTALAARRLGLAIRFPPAVRQLAAVANFVSSMPGVLVVDDDGDVPPGVAPSRVLSLRQVAPPASDEDASLFYQLSDYDARAEDELPEASRLRQRGVRAYGEGRYAEAAGLWEKWAEAEPENAEAWALLGNARNRLRDTPAAIEAYGRSLAISPGQIDLALEYVRLLEQAGRIEDSERALDLYARSFPEDGRIAVAQALWLDRRGRRTAGREILRGLVARDPADIRSRLALQSLLDAPADRYANMHELLEVGTSGPTGLLGFGHDLVSSELLTGPEASVFFDFLRETATNAPQQSVRELYEDLLPLTEPVVEQFDANRLSSNWSAFGTPLSAIAGAYDLRAAADMSEAYLRLRRSELLRDGFIEVTISESVGAFWLYARRSSRSLVRFGFDGDGFLRIQTWSDGEIRTGDSRAWVRPGGDVTLRLEVRGDGAIGLVDGKPGFATPLQIPQSIAYGWWSVAPFSPELGIARARISRIGAGPLSAGIAFLRETDVARASDALDRLRPRAGEISAVSPVLFAQIQDGTLPVTPLADLMPFRMFCSYHRLRLVPSVALDYDSYVNPESLVRLIREHRLAGLVLHARNRPSDEWFAETTALLESTSADLIVVVSEKPLLPLEPSSSEAAAAERLAAIPPVTVIELQRGSLLLHPSRKEWTVPATAFTAWPPASRADETAPPHLVVLATVDPNAAPEPVPAVEPAPAEKPADEPVPAEPVPEDKPVPADPVPAEKPVPAEADPAEEP